MSPGTPVSVYTLRPMPPLSAVIITQDEERDLPAALDSVRFCDEVLVVDSGSADRTRELAQAAGARVVIHTPWPGFRDQRNYAVLAATHDWVLALDADERVTPALRDEICRLRDRGFGMAGYRIPRVVRYLGRWVRGTDWYPDPQLRLFDRRRGRWGGELVHESVEVTGPVGRLHAELEHFPYADVSDHMIKIDSYTTLWARQSLGKRRVPGGLEMVLTSLWAFLRNYVMKRGVRLGHVGVTVSMLNAYYTYAKLAKLRELAERNEAPPVA
jgi:glycosyltransferase involved in cell wall biosynthesis